MSNEVLIVLYILYQSLSNILEEYRMNIDVVNLLDFGTLPSFATF